MQRFPVLSTLLAFACSGSTTRPARPDLAAFNAECYEAIATPNNEVVGSNPETCAYQDGMPRQVYRYQAMARLRIECDPDKVTVEVLWNRHLPEKEQEFIEVACNDEYPYELVCGWTSTLRITALDFGDGTTAVIIRSDCPVPEYGGVRCYGEAWPHANFGSTEGHCAVGDTFVIDNIAAGDELEAWADPID